MFIYLMPLHDIYCVQKKNHPKRYRLSIIEGITSFNRFWYRYYGTTGHQM